MQIGKASVDFEAHLIDGPAGTHTVEPLVMKVLSVLTENAGQVVTRDSIIDQVWGVGFGGDERLSRAISLLRKALGDTRKKHKYIKTVPKIGYILTTEIKRPIAQNPTESAPIAEPTKAPKAIITIVLAAIIAVLGLGIGNSYYKRRQAILPPAKPPLVMIMDSAHPARIYDEQIKSEGGTNADILSDILADLPIRTQKELISPSWHRYEPVKQFDPDLILIHYSGFNQENAGGDRKQLRLLVEYFLKTDTEFLVYSRADQDWLDGNMNIILQDVYTAHPTMKDRIELFPLLEYGEPMWKDPNSAQGIKLKVKSMLDLE